MKHYFLIADIHGDFKPIREFYNRNKDKFGWNENTNREENIIVLLGDAGLNFYFNYRDEKIKAKLGSYPFTYFIVRGNHEERPSICANHRPDRWKRETWNRGTVWIEEVYPYIKYALDVPSFYNLNGYRTLVLPGAYSVDKYYRLANNWGWFEHEQLSKEEMRDGIKLIESYNWKCDLVLSHTCPIMYEPTDLFLSVVDQSMVEKDMERYLGQIEFRLDYKCHLWGHYHQYREYPRNIGIPSYDNPRQLMLFNDYVVDLEDVMTNDNLVNRL